MTSRDIIDRSVMFKRKGCPCLLNNGERKACVYIGGMVIIYFHLTLLFDAFQENLSCIIFGKSLCHTK